MSSDPATRDPDELGGAWVRAVYQCVDCSEEVTVVSRAKVVLPEADIYFGEL